MLLVCNFSGFTIWNYITNRCALPWGRLFLPILAFLSCLCVVLRPRGLSPIRLGMYIVVLAQFASRKSCW